MSKIIGYIFYKFIFFFNTIYNFFLKKNFIIYLYNNIIRNSYLKLKVNNKIVNFFCPNDITTWRVKTFFSKEPGTLNFINSFKGKRFVFWDIGSNIGLYSIYAAIKNKNCKIYSFEPSYNNLNILSKNISLNNLSNQIRICPFLINFNNRRFSFFSDQLHSEGGSHNQFSDNKINFYDIQTLSLNINFLISNNIIKKPNYIKCDIDGLEYYLLKSANNLLNYSKLYKILVECDDSKNLKKIIKLMKLKKFFINKNFVTNFGSNNLLFERKNSL